MPSTDRLRVLTVVGGSKERREGAVPEVERHVGPVREVVAGATVGTCSIGGW
jgi:hypothetical protein